MDGAYISGQRSYNFVTFGPYQSEDALPVFLGLNLADVTEQSIARGARVSEMDMFVQWMVNAPNLPLNWLYRDERGEPFAVAAFAWTGQAGVAQAAFLSRAPAVYGRALMQAARSIRDLLPSVTRDLNIRRIECRCWRDHPSAPRFLEFLGFQREAVARGFGAAGDDVFLQYAWLRSENDVR